MNRTAELWARRQIARQPIVDDWNQNDTVMNIMESFEGNIDAAHHML